MNRARNIPWRAAVGGAALFWWSCALCFLAAWSVPGGETPQPAGFDVRPGFTVISSVCELRDCLAASGQRIRMKPGTYSITNAEPDRKTVVHVRGNDNYFDLRGVTLQLDTQILGALRGKVHELCVYRADQADVGKTSARDIQLCNGTPHRVVLSPDCSGCNVRSVGPVTNDGKSNTVGRF